MTHVSHCDREPTLLALKGCVHLKQQILNTISYYWKRYGAKVAPNEYLRHCLYKIFFNINWLVSNFNISICFCENSYQGNQRKRLPRNLNDCISTQRSTKLKELHISYFSMFFKVWSDAGQDSSSLHPTSAFCQSDIVSPKLVENFLDFFLKDCMTSCSELHTYFRCIHFSNWFQQDCM